MGGASHIVFETEEAGYRWIKLNRLTVTTAAWADDWGPDRLLRASYRLAPTNRNLDGRANWGFLPYRSTLKAGEGAFASEHTSGGERRRRGRDGLPIAPAFAIARTDRTPGSAA